MNGLLVWLVPVALGMGFFGLLAFLWSMKHGQLEDLDGAAERVFQQTEDAPLPDPEHPGKRGIEDRKEC